MPKAMQYTKGSIIYFEGDHDDRIFIMQAGAVLLSSTDIESGQPTAEQVKAGEFFGVKSAFGHFPREETATALVPTIAVALTVQEFEILFSNNKQLIMKMLRVFSNQLRQIHKKTESILNNITEDQQSGMLAVAKAFYDDEKYRSACDVYLKYLTRYPTSPDKEEIAKLYAESKMRNERMVAQHRIVETPAQPEDEGTALKLFNLPAFERFAKEYEPGQVIIAEHEPGDCFYLIQSGRVQLVKCVNGTSKNLDILKSGEFFGEMAILENSPRSATCVAAEKVEVLEFNKQNFEVLIMGNPQMAIMLIKLFCKRIYDQNRRLKTLVIKDPQARIGDVFLMIDEMNPPANQNDVTRKLPLTIQDVSHWAGLPVEDVKEEINKFVEKRKIEVFENYIIVKNIVDMKRYVEQRCQIRL